MIGFIFCLLIIVLSIIITIISNKKTYYKYPECYKTVNITYKFPGKETQQGLAWLSYNDDIKPIWTLCRDDITIIDDKYVIKWE